MFGHPPWLFPEPLLWTGRAQVKFVIQQVMAGRGRWLAAEIPIETTECQIADHGIGRRDTGLRTK